MKPLITQVPDPDDGAVYPITPLAPVSPPYRTTVMLVLLLAGAVAMPVATHLAIVFVVAGPVPAPDGVQVTVPVPVPATATVTVSAISKVAHRPAGTVIMLEFVAVADSHMMSDATGAA